MADKQVVLISLSLLVHTIVFDPEANNSSIRACNLQKTA